MPFKKTSLNEPAEWVPPTPEEIDSFNERLAHKDVNIVDPDFKSQLVELQKFAQETAQLTHEMVQSNDTALKSIEALVEKGSQPVDLILPVYGGLNVVRLCLDSIVKRTHWPYRLIIIDDASPDERVRTYLKKWVKDHPGHTLDFNKRNRGFAATVNKGIRLGSSPYICLVNSDVIVTENWLTKMVMAMESDPRNQIVNPCTNNTALIDIPLQEGYSYIDMNKGLEALSVRKYPEIMPTGFLFMFRRSTYEFIGGFDEGYVSYGEESDWWMRTINSAKNNEYMRWRSVLADDTYVFHERGSSFAALGDDEHLGQRKSGSIRFRNVWPKFGEWQKQFDLRKSIGYLREAMPDMVLQKDCSPYNIAFVTFDTQYCGGMRYIADIVNELDERGINAKVVHLKRSTNAPNTTINELRSAPIRFKDGKEFLEQFTTKVFDKGVVVAATNEISPYIHALCSNFKDLKFVLLAQSDDVAISPSREVADRMKENYKLPEYIISVSKWLEEKIRDDYEGKTIGWARPGYDKYTFFPGDREEGDDRPTVLFAINAGYPFKGMDRGIQTASALWNLAQRHGKEIRILAYGVGQITQAPFITCVGRLSQSRLASILRNEIDVFCDPAHIHSYGLPSLEAMGSGVLPVCWDNKGIGEYHTDPRGAKVVAETAAPELVAQRIFDILQDEKELKERKKHCIKEANQYRDNGVNDFINLLEDKLDLRLPKRRIAIVIPHMRKHGGPTTIIHMANLLKKRGHDVSLHLIYNDISPEVERIVDVPIYVNWKEIPPCDVLITNSDNPHNSFFSGLPHVRKKVLLKLSHNERFRKEEDNSLKLKWDKIVTSTQWLADVCKNPREGWEHPPVDATRVGWFHYGHDIFNVPPDQRSFNSLKGGVVISTLIHHHPLKGSKEALKVLERIHNKYGAGVRILGVGEVPDFQKAKIPWLTYAFELNRSEMANMFKQTDIWLSCSHTEGLGRMSLEAMSSSCAVVMTDTGAEFAKPDHNCLVTSNNIDEMEKAIDSLLGNDDLRAKLSVGGYETASRYANPDPFIENLEKVIKNIL